MASSHSKLSFEYLDYHVRTDTRTTRGGLTLLALGRCPGAHHFRGPTPTIHANLKRAQIDAKIASKQNCPGVSISPCIHPSTDQYYSKRHFDWTLWALGQCPGAHQFRGPTLTIQVNINRAQIVAIIAFALGPAGVSVRPWVLVYIFAGVAGRLIPG